MVSEAKLTLEYLKKVVFFRFQIPYQKQIMTVLRDDCQVRLREDFALELFEIEEDTIIQVEKVLHKNNDVKFA